MNSKRIVLISGLGLALLLAFMWALSNTFVPVRAYTDEIVAPAPTKESIGAPRGRQNVPFEEYIVDGRSQGLPGVNALGSSSAWIANGEFENGRDGSWAEYSSNGWFIIMDSADLSVVPHNGNWAAWLGGDYDDVSYISQSLAIPGGTSTLRFWNWIASEDECGYDFGWVKINDTNVQTISLCVDNETNGWVERTADLSSYGGQTVTLEIRVETDASLNSNYFVDDVTLETTVPPDSTSTTYLPVALSQFWAGYFDDFSDPNSGWASGDNETRTYGYLNGEFQILHKIASRRFLITPDLVLPSDYRIEVDARQASTGTGSYGLVFGFRFVDTYETYEFLVHPGFQEYKLDKRSMDGSLTTLIDPAYSSAIHQGMGTNHLQVDRIGTLIYLYINGTLVTTFNDSSFTSPGRDAGVRAYSYDSAPVDVRFDNFSATRP